MNKGVQTIIYPVTDLARARAEFIKLLGAEPYVDTAFYVGFKVGGQDIGLDPNTHKEGMTAYYHVGDIRQALQTLLSAGAQTVQEVKDVGGGRLVASARDVEGNMIGLIQDA